MQELGHRENISFTLLQTDIFVEAVIGALSGHHFYEEGKASLELSKWAFLSTLPLLEPYTCIFTVLILRFILIHALYLKIDDL